jgi:trimethylamine--corrinoid protein Co-methyltransferase
MKPSPDMPAFRMLTDEKVAQIHQAALKVLAETGIKVATQEAVQLLADAGCDVNTGSDIVKMPARIVEACLESCPHEIQLYDRDGAACMQLGGRRVYAGIGTTCIYIRDHESGERREVELADMALAGRVLDALPHLDFAAIPLIVNPNQETPQHLAAQVGFETLASNTTKPIMLLGEDASTLKDMLDMAAILAGGKDILRKKPFVCVYPSIISPLVFDADTLEKINISADLGLPVRCGSAPLSGGTGPVTAAGMLVICIAESLAGIVLSQLRSPGAPVIMGNTSGNMDMKTGSPYYCGPETSRISMAVADLAHYYQLPVLSPAGLCSDMECNIQAALELMMSIYGCYLSGSNLVAHVGGMEAGMTFSLELVVLGDEITGMVKRIMEGIHVDDDTLALDTIQSVGPGGHFLTSVHTLHHFRQEQWQSSILNRCAIDQWQQEGSKQTRLLIKEKLNTIIATHQPKPIAEDVQAELTKFVDQVKNNRLD